MGRRRRNPRTQHRQQHHDKYRTHYTHTEMSSAVDTTTDNQNKPKKIKYRNRRATTEDIDLIATRIFGPFYNDNISES